MHRNCYLKKINVIMLFTVNVIGIILAELIVCKCSIIVIEWHIEFSWQCMTWLYIHMNFTDEIWVTVEWTFLILKSNTFFHCAADIHNVFVITKGVAFSKKTRESHNANKIISVPAHFRIGYVSWFYIEISERALKICLPDIS